MIRDHLPEGFPTIVTLCGSTKRALEAFREQKLKEECAGKLVFSIASDMMPDDELVAAGMMSEEDLAFFADSETHFRKIDLSDEIFVLNVGGYIGWSTRRELDYARAHGKHVRFLEPYKEEEHTR